MYLSFYRLTTKPFPEKTAPDKLWLNDKTKQALSAFRNGILENKGLLVLTGDVGTGKTSFINSLTQTFPDHIVAGSVVNPGLDLRDFLHVLADIFRLPENTGEPDKILASFKQFLVDAAVDGKKVVLIIDEAQQLSDALLQLVQRLVELHDDRSRLLNIILVGQNDFNAALTRPGMNDLRRMIAVTHNIVRLTASETNQYIKHHLRLAGGSEDIFSPGAIDAVFRVTGGSPRLINLICDLALLNGFTSEVPVISKEIISACRTKLMLPNDGIAEQPPVAVPGTESSNDRHPARPRKIGWRKASYGLLVMIVLILFGARHLVNRMGMENDAGFETITAPGPADPLAAQTERNGGAPEPSGPAVAQSILPRPTAEDPPMATKTRERAVPTPAKIQVVATEEPPPNIREQPRQPVETAAEQAAERQPAAAEQTAATPNQENAPPEDNAVQIAAMTSAKADNEKPATKKPSPVPVITQPKPLPEKIELPPGMTTGSEPRTGSKKVITVFFGNLRDGPGMDANIIGVAKQGDIVIDLNNKAKWHFVKLEDGRLGWMHQSLFAPIQDIADETAPHSVPARQAPAERASTALTVPESRVTVRPVEVKTAHHKKEKTPAPSAAETLPSQTSPPPAPAVADPVRIARDRTSTPAAPPAPEKSLQKTGNPDALEWTQKSFESVSQGKFDRAILEATRAIALDPGLVNPYINRAWAYCETGLYEKAIADCQTALKIEPRNALAFNNIGLAYHRMTKLATARDYYQKACELELDVACGNYRLLLSAQ